MKIIGLAYNVLSKKFEKLGRKISDNTSLFVVVSVFSAIIFTTGLQRAKFSTSEKDFIPVGGVIDKYKSRLTELFPIDISSKFQSDRVFEVPFYGSVIIQAADSGSVLRKSVFREVVLLDERIRNFTVNEEGTWTYSDICAKNERKCFENKILLLNNKIEEIENRSLLLQYPIEEDDKENGILSLGGVKLNSDAHIFSADAIKLIYFLDGSLKKKEEIVRKWEEVFIDNLEKMEFINIKIDKDTFTTKEKLQDVLVFVSLGYIPYSSILLLVFTVITTLPPDFLRSKPWIGITSLISIGMSLGSGFGLLSYCGISVTSSAIMAPFLVLGIGMDDSFVMLSVWMKTDPKKSVRDRIAETYFEAGVPITITSFTNIISFFMGYIFSSFVLLRVFCIFMSACLIFDYIYQITFVGAFLVIFGRAEEKKLHSVAFRAMENSSPIHERSFLRKIFCYVQPIESTDKTISKKSCSIENFWTTLGTFMTKSYVKAIIILIYFLYFGVMIWGFSKYSLEASFEIGIVRDTYRYSFFQTNKQYYSQYQNRLQIFIDQELDYADPEVQLKVKGIHESIESDPLMANSSLTESWFRSYLEFISDERSSLLLGSFNLTNSRQFLHILRHFFLRVPDAKRFRQDIAFNENYTSIICSRFLVQTNVTRDGNHFYSQLTNMRKKLDTFPYKTVIYHPLFYYFDIIDQIPTICTQTFSIVTVSVSVVSALLLPDIICIICVIFSIFSVGAGVMSFMFLFHISLNVFTVMIYIMVIGFCVDYGAHVSCAYISLTDGSPNDRLVKSIAVTAKPILQGCFSTILAVVACGFAPADIIVISLIIVSLSCLVAAFHSIIFLSVILSLIDSLFSKISCCKMHKRDTLSSRNYNGEMQGIENIAVNRFKDF